MHDRTTLHDFTAARSPKLSVRVATTKLNADQRNALATLAFLLVHQVLGLSWRWLFGFSALPRWSA